MFKVIEGEGEFFLLNMMPCVLVGEKIKPVLEDYMASVLRDSCKSCEEVTKFVSLQFVLQSSAKSLYLTGGGRLLMISFIATKNRERHLGLNLAEDHSRCNESWIECFEFSLSMSNWLKSLLET